VVFLLQVTNTPWGDRVTFMFNPEGDVSPKALHVSPFMDMQNTWWVLSVHVSCLLLALHGYMLVLWLYLHQQQALPRATGCSTVSLDILKLVSHMFAGT
jgi:hypothetical protein